MYSYIAVAVVVVLFILAVVLVCHFRLRKRKNTPPKNFKEGNPGKINPTMTFEEQIDLLPYDKRYEFPQKRLKFGNHIGKGTFGALIQATAQGIVPNEKETHVVVRIINNVHDKAVSGHFCM